MKMILKAYAISLLGILSIIALAFPIYSLYGNAFGSGWTVISNPSGFQAIKDSFFVIFLIIGPAILVAMDFVSALAKYKGKLAIAIPVVCIACLFIAYFMTKNAVLARNGIELFGDYVKDYIRSGFGFGFVIALLSYLATIVAGAVQYHGYSLDKAGIDKLKKESVKFAEYAKTNGVNLAKVEKDADAKLDAILKKNKRVKMSEADRLVLRGEIYTELANVAIIEDYLGKSGLKVSPNEVEERRRILTRYNERMVATNALVYAQASNAWSQVVAGKLSFHDAVLKYDESEDPTEDRDLWGSFSMGELASEPAVRAVVQRMKVGDVSPPVEGDNGLVIVKLLAVEEGTRQVSVEKSYRLGRIFFHLYEVWNDEGDKELEQDLLNIHRKELVSDLMRRLRDSATITYPKKKGE